MIKEAGELSENDMQKLFDDVIEKEYTRSADLYKEVGANFVPYAQNTEMQQLTQALITQSNNELKSITGTMGFMLDYGDGQGLRFTPHTEIFDDYLNSAVMGIASGAFDYNTMIRKVVTQMTNSGLRTVDYASGRHDRVDVAARRAVLTGLSQLTGRITDTNAAALNTDHFEVAWHAGARPTHQVWQGRVWSKKELVEVCGLGSVTGLLGANCYHDYYPFIPGVSERMYSDEWLDEMNREENTPKIFKGKEYTAYEARQHQRYIERCMRAQREKVELLKEGGADKDEVMLARCKYQAQLDEYKRFSKVMKLPEQRERIYYDMKGRVAPPRDMYQQYLADQAEKRRRIQSEVDKHKERAEEARQEDLEKNTRDRGVYSKYPINEGIFSSNINPQGEKQTDVMRPHNIMKDLRTSESGRSALDFLERNQIPVDIQYNVDHAPGRMGYYDAFYNEIIVYADMHESIHELSKTIIHEAYHARYNTGTQKEEVACRIEEAKHDGKELNMRGKIDIIKAVKNNIHYNGMPWR